MAKKGKHFGADGTIAHTDAKPYNEEPRLGGDPLAKAESGMKQVIPSPDASPGKNFCDPEEYSEPSSVEAAEMNSGKEY